jgi:hypothetical protein
MLEQIRDIVCGYYKVPVVDFEGKSRKGRLPLARRAFYITANRYTTEGRVKMAELCGGRTQSTATLVLHQANPNLLDPEYHNLSKDVDVISDLIDEKIFREIGDDLHLRITTYDTSSILVAISSGTIIHVGTYDGCIIARERFFKRYVQRAS